MKYFILLFLLNSSLSLLASEPYQVLPEMCDYLELEEADTLNLNQTWDENSIFPLNLEFDFRIGENSISSINVKAGGIQFVGFGHRELYVFHVPFGGYMLKDRGIENSISPILYKTEGEAGSRITKIEWKNAGFAQWFSSSDSEDYVNFQVWLIERDCSIEIHFGPSQTDPGTFGHPEAMSQTGPFPQFNYTSDSTIQIYGSADNPSYRYSEFPNFADIAIDATPSDGIVYFIIPNTGNNTGGDSFYNYLFKLENSEYADLIDPVNVTNSDIWDENSVYVVDIGFRFILNNQAYTKLNIYAGGGISFSGKQERSLRVFHTPFGGYLLTCRNNMPSESMIEYTVSGEESDRIFKIQWKNAGFVQWYPTSSANDFIDFQIWLYESDDKLEIHFGNSLTNPGTYGYPDATSDANPGPSVQLSHYNCEKVLCILDYANNPSYDYLDLCFPNYSFIDGTPECNIIYQFIPEQTFVGVLTSPKSEIKIFPNPITDFLIISGEEQIKLIDIYSLTGKLIQKIPVNFTDSKLIRTENFIAGRYIVKVTLKNSDVICQSFIKY